MVKLRPKEPLQRFSVAELSFDCLLGTGGFSTVICVHHVGPQHEDDEPSSSEKDQVITTPELTVTSDDSLSSSSDLQPSSTTSLHQQTTKPRLVEGELALKALHKKALSSPKCAQVATQDLRVEVCLLSHLNHSNIVKLVGISKDFFDSDSERPFLILEKLEYTLSDVLKKWQTKAIQNVQPKGTPLHYLSQASQTSRLRKVAPGLASAMKYLSDRRIVYRDLKPDNIGFDKNGEVKLFDFACARAIDPGQKLKNRVGTTRYMAPEQASRKPYDCSVDVYSFGLMLWSICTLVKPYKSFVDKEDLDYIVKEPNIHPSLEPIASVPMKNLLESCWLGDPDERPTFEFVALDLQMELKKPNKIVL